MKLYLNAGFGDPLSADDIDLIRALGYAGVRQNVNSESEAASLVHNILQPRLDAIFIVPVDDPDACHAIAHVVAEACMAHVEVGTYPSAFIEVGNEEDLSAKRWSKDPLQWAALCRDVYSISWAHTQGLVPVISGGISSLSKNAISWLKRSGVADSPIDAIGYHQYRSTPPNEPLDGYRNRNEEFRALREAAGDHRICMTETGWHTAERKEGWGPFGKTWRYTDEQVLEFLRVERDLNAAEGSDMFVQYQLNDGPDPKNDQDHFGIRTVSGVLKPSASLPRA